MAILVPAQGLSNLETSPVVRDAALARLEEAALNATAVAEQMFYDGWLVRWAPGQARRMRCVNVLASALGTIDARLAFARRLYARKRLPLVFRLTSIGPDFELDAQLAARGFEAQSETRVMHCALAAIEARHTALRFERVDTTVFTQTVGALRGSSVEDIAIHAKRISSIALERITLLAWTPDGDCVGAAMAVVEDDLVGVFDVVVNSAHRRRGYGSALMAQLAARAAALGAKTIYLQVESGNQEARGLYERLGFTDAYAYWYRTIADARPASADQRT